MEEDKVVVDFAIPVYENGQVAGEPISGKPANIIPRSVCQGYVDKCGFNYKKVPTTKMLQIGELFGVKTREGTVYGQPGDWLAIDSRGWPYIIAQDEQQRIYRRVRREVKPMVRPEDIDVPEPSEDAGKGFAGTP